MRWQVVLGEKGCRVEDDGFSISHLGVRADVSSSSEWKGAQWHEGSSGRLKTGSDDGAARLVENDEIPPH